MPFAGYDDFDDCVAKNSDKDDPEAYCAAIKDRAETGTNVVSLADRAAARQFRVAESVSRHPAARNRREFRRPK